MLKCSTFPAPYVTESKAVRLLTHCWRLMADADSKSPNGTNHPLLDSHFLGVAHGAVIVVRRWN